MLAAAKQPTAIGDTTVGVTASIGIAVHQPGNEARETLHRADAAMYAAKASGKARSVLAHTSD